MKKDKTVSQIAKELGVPVVEIDGKEYVHLKRFPEVIGRTDNEKIIRRLDLILELLKQWRKQQ